MAVSMLQAVSLLMLDDIAVSLLMLDDIAVSTIMLNDIIDIIICS